jgi:hypothetical protein
MKPLRIKPIQIKPVRLTLINPSISIGKPKINGGLDRRFATGLGRTLRQQMGDQKRRRWF